MAFSNGLQDNHLASVVLPQRHNQLGDLGVLPSCTVDVLGSECPTSSSDRLFLSLTICTISRNTLILTHVSQQP